MLTSVKMKRKKLKYKTRRVEVNEIADREIIEKINTGEFGSWKNTVKSIIS